jgi:alpha-tubulin suppressor-like RCC1 family protein
MENNPMSSMMTSRFRRDAEAGIQSLLFPWRSKRRSGAMEVCQGTGGRFPTGFLCGGRWLLLLAVATSFVNASAASAYDLAAGRYDTCAIDDNGVTCWGDDSSGQTTVPAGLVNPVALAAGDRHTCALDDNGVTCWGSDQLGESTVPPGLIHPTVVSAGAYHTCAIDDHGVSCWGWDA